MRAIFGKPFWILLPLTMMGLPGCQPSGRGTSGSAAPTARPTGRPTASASTEVAGAIEVIRSYYRAIDGRRYLDAYRFWGANGAASGKSFEEFRSGFSETAAVETRIGTPGRIEGAAGSRYLDIPVRVVARLRNGALQEFTGMYTMRRSVVDGATPDQRAWHIDSARIRQVR